jgi:putative peptidoglycan lipid II flippase
MSLARNIATVGGATLFSRLLGFLRDVGIAAALGTSVFADALFAVLQIANFFRRLLAEGAFNSAFVPLWLRIKADAGEAGAGRFLQEAFVAMLVAAGALAALGFLLAPAVIDALAPGFGAVRHGLAVNYLRIVSPYVALAGVVAVLAALLNAHQRFLAVALGVVAFNAVLLAALIEAAAFGGTPEPTAVAAALAYAVVIAGAAQLVVAAFGLRGLHLHVRFLHLGFSSDTRRLFARAVPGLIAAGIPQLKLIAGTMVASSSPAAVSWLYYANRLYELPLGVVAVATASVLVPAIAAGVRSGEHEAIASAQSRGLEIVLGLAIPAAVAFAVLAAPIARTLFERGAFGPRDTAEVAAALAAICAGLPGHTLEKVLGAVSFAHEDTRTPMLAALAGLAAAIAGALTLFPHYGATGVAAAIAISGWVGATALAFVLHRRGWLKLERAALRRLPLIVLAAAVMGAVILAVGAMLPSESASQLGRIAGLALLVALGLAVYLGSLWLTGVVRLGDVRAAIVERRPLGG